MFPLVAGAVGAVYAHPRTFSRSCLQLIYYLVAAVSAAFSSITTILISNGTFFRPALSIHIDPGGGRPVRMKSTTEITCTRNL